MMKKMMHFKILKALFFVNIFLIFLEFILFDMNYILALEIGFFSSSLVVLASMESYKNMVTTRLNQNLIILDDSTDELDKIDDPYGLYNNDVSEKSEEDLVEVFKEEKKKQKKRRRVSQVIRDSIPSFSFMRLGAYLLLVLGFFYLNRHQLLHIPTYLIALGLPSIVSVFVLLSQAKELE